MILTNAIITAYCMCSHCCPDSIGICANGQPPIQGITVAASRSIPLGTHVVIKGHTYTVQDRLAKRFDKRIDIYFRNHDEARRFGKQTNNVIVLK